MSRKFTEALVMTLGEHRVEKDKNKTFHSFRHYICTKLATFQDIKDKVIQDIVGHENIGTTDRVYKDPTPLDVMLEAMRRLPDLTDAAYQASTVRKIVPPRRQMKQD
ncbi:tyrosine-type recombinase/integrase [Devosia sp. A369]